MNESSDPTDDTVVGNRKWSLDNYGHIQTALRLLHAKLSSWNTTAIAHGATSSPYEYEVRTLGDMIEWAEPRLANKALHELTVEGINVEGLRLIKAALLHAAWNFDTEAVAEAKESWPQRVLEAVRGRARKAHEIAAGIKFQPAEVLQDLRPDFALERKVEDANAWDVFISHASEDKGPLVDELARALRAAGLSVWYDDFTLTIGDSLRRSIDKGLARSKFGVVVLSPAFFAKEWPQRELDGLVSREAEGNKVVLPIWHSVDVEYVRRFSPTLADRLGISSERGVEAITAAVLQAVNK